MIQYLVIDVDGTLTDGTIYIGNTGEFCKGFNVKDGLGIQRIITKGIIPVILTSRDSEIVTQRCRELGVSEIYQGIKDKKEGIEKIIEKYKIKTEELAYIADDINDLDAIQYAYIRACPNDAAFEMKNICNFVSHYNGGCGAVRELCDYLVSLN